MGLFSRKSKWKNFDGCINIYSNLRHSDIPKIINEDRVHTLQFYEYKNPSVRTWKVLNSFFEKYSQIGLRICWYNELDFSFYQEIPFVRAITIDSYNTKDFSPLLNNLNLKKLGIGETKSAAVDLSFIKEFDKLESLYIDGMKKGLENVSKLINLRELTFRGIKMSNIQFISNLKKLSTLKLLFGSYKNLDSISELQNLKSIEFSRVRQIPNYNFLKSLKNLEILQFEGMSKLEELPDLSGLNNLKRLQVYNNLRLKDIGSIKRIPNLKVFLISFAENSKSAEKKSLIEQTVDILLDSDSIKYSNILHWTDQTTTKKLIEKGIEKWSWDIKL